jgi:hypothetical protein
VPREYRHPVERLYLGHGVEAIDDNPAYSP